MSVGLRAGGHKVGNASAVGSDPRGRDERTIS